MDLQKIVSKNIRLLRSAKGLTQHELALRMKVHVQYISRLETTPQNLTLDILERLSKGLGVSVGEVVGETAPPSDERLRVVVLKHVRDAVTALEAVERVLR